MDLRLYDIVALARPVGQLPRGARGTIVDEFDDGVTVEFLAPDGETLALEDLALADVVLVERPSVIA